MVEAVEAESGRRGLQRCGRSPSGGGQVSEKKRAKRNRKEKREKRKETSAARVGERGPLRGNQGQVRGMGWRGVVGGGGGYPAGLCRDGLWAVGRG